MLCLVFYCIALHCAVLYCIASHCIVLNSVLKGSVLYMYLFSLANHIMSNVKRTLLAWHAEDTRRAKPHRKGGSCSMGTKRKGISAQAQSQSHYGCSALIHEGAMASVPFVSISSNQSAANINHSDNQSRAKAATSDGVPAVLSAVEAIRLTEHP